MAKLKIGFIGCGGIANQKHLPGMKQQVEKGRVELVAFCDLIPERAEKAAKEYGTPHNRCCSCSDPQQRSLRDYCCCS